ncbi:MAG TPA: hypothetical protein VG406_05500 [Isosphaeraceae bacterium]|jgi:hypothetical protein|nr:hypothetical protein [Isosphaeraceae bacterium]
MARAPLTTTVRDPDLDPSPPGRLGTLGDEPQRYQRLVANPFLGFVGILVLVVAAEKLILEQVLGSPASSAFAVLAVLIILPLLPRLFHYHCLDCGATGRLTRWRSHICPASADRYAVGRPRLLRGPSPTVQFLLWVYLVLAVGLAIELFRR